MTSPSRRLPDWQAGSVKCLGSESPDRDIGLNDLEDPRPRLPSPMELGPLKGHELPVGSLSESGNLAKRKSLLGRGLTEQRIDGTCKVWG